MIDRFTTDTAVRRVDLDEFAAECRAGWRVIGGEVPNGGYLLALGARAMAQRAERPDPVTVTAHFLRPPDVGPLRIATELVRDGARHRTVSARIIQDGVERVRLLGTFGDLSNAEGPTEVRRRPPDWPAVDTLPPVVPELHGQPTPEFIQRLDHRIPAATLGWTKGVPSGEGMHGGWCRWPDADAVDTLGLLFVADAYPPVIFDLGVADIAWAPTIELTVQVRGRPAPGWLATRFRTQAVTGGYFEEDGDIWDAEGRLVALTRQLALAGRPRSR